MKRKNIQNIFISKLPLFYSEKNHRNENRMNENRILTALLIGNVTFLSLRIRKTNILSLYICLCVRV